jgi:hypothetical protein
MKALARNPYEKSSGDPRKDIGKSGDGSTVDVSFTDRFFHFFHQASERLGHSHKIFIQNSGVFQCGSAPEYRKLPARICTELLPENFVMNPGMLF